MTLDIKTIPKVIVKTGKYGSVEIVKQDGIYLLKHSDVDWNVYTLPGGMREYYEQWSGYDLAYGDVLISGFGFGQMATWLASKPEVKSVTVLEVSQDIVDVFLINNKMPDNVSVVIADANNYKTDKKYDCVIFDHIQNGQPYVSFYKDICQAAKEIPHDLFWFWSIEYYYARYYYHISHLDLYVNNINLDVYDFSKHWSILRQILDMPTIPSISKEKLSIYMKHYFTRI
jgi:hypothetical protein